MTSAAARPFGEGNIVDQRFPLLEWLGGAGRTQVFRTQLPGSVSQPAVIKLVPVTAEAASELARWQRAARLSHPHLLGLFEMGECQVQGGRRLYLVMEYAEENLEQVLPQRPLLAREVAELIPPIADTLSFLHERGLVHGRIKPSNIAAVGNQLKLTSDSLQPFGLPARSSPLSPYDAPEIENRELSGASDLWSLGMTLVTCFTQQPLSWIRQRPGDPEVPESIPLPYRRIAQECLRVDPKERCTVREIREWLKPETPGERVAPPRPGRTRVIGAALLVAALLGLLLALILIPNRAGKKPEKTHAQEERPTTAALPNSSPTSSGAARPSSLTPDGVLEQVLPKVPKSALETIHGKILVKVEAVVGPGGEVSSATLTLPGPSGYFARLALEASKRWKFQPAELNGQPRRWLLVYRFTRSGVEAAPVERP